MPLSSFEPVSFPLAELDAEGVLPETHALNICEQPTGNLDASTAAMAIAHFMPENAIIVDEAITSGVAGAAPGMKLRQWEATRP